MNGRIYKLKHALIEFLFHEKGIIRELEIPEKITLYCNYFINHMVLGEIVYTNTRSILDRTAQRRMKNNAILMEHVKQIITNYDDFELKELLYDLQALSSREFYRDDMSLSTHTADEIKNINLYYSNAMKSFQEIAELVKATRDSYK